MGKIRSRKILDLWEVLNGVFNNIHLVGTEELAHLEMVAAIVRQLTKGLSAEELEAAGFDKYYVDHTAGIWPQAAGGVPFNACEFQSKGDVITDLMEDLAADAAHILSPPTATSLKFPMYSYWR